MFCYRTAFGFPSSVFEPRLYSDPHYYNSAKFIFTWIKYFSGALSVASSMTFSSVGAIPKGRGYGTTQRTLTQPLPNIGGLQIATPPQPGTPVKLPSATQSPLRPMGRGMPGTPQRGMSTAVVSEMPSSISGPPVRASLMSNVSTLPRISTPPRPQMVQPASIPGTPLRMPSNVPTPTQSRYVNFWQFLEWQQCHSFLILFSLCFHLTQGQWSIHLKIVKKYTTVRTWMPNIGIEDGSNSSCKVFTWD